MYLFNMGKRIIISESEKKNILSLYETTTVAPPPSESVLVVTLNPFKYPKFESARREYSSDLKDGDMFYIQTGFNKFKMELEFNKNFRIGLYNKTAKINDDIYTFLKSSITESTNFGGGGGNNVGWIDVKKNDGSPLLYKITAKFDNSSNKYNVLFSKNTSSNYDNNSFSVQSISDLYTKGFKENITDKSKVEDMPDEYFEIRKVQRQQTDF